MKNIIIILLLGITSLSAQEKNQECKEEMGANLFFDSSISLYGGGSCAGASCHVGSNNFMPTDKLQGGEGVVRLDKGMQICKYGPKNITVDAPKINSPGIRGFKHKELALHKGVKKELQPTAQFGFTAHQIDTVKTAQMDKYKYYAAVCYQSSEVTGHIITDALLKYMNSLEVYTDWAEYVKTGQMTNRIKRTLPTIQECLSCHSNPQGSSDKFGHVVLNSSNKNILDTTMVLTRGWSYSNDTPLWFWNGSYNSNSFYGLKKHAENEGIELTDKQIKEIQKFIKKSAN